MNYQQNQDKEFPNETTDGNHGLSVFLLLHKNQTIISVRFTHVEIKNLLLPNPSTTPGSE